MSDEIDYNALGQVIDTTWGRTSTPKTASYSVKFSLHGNVLTASYAAIVNFGTEVEMIHTKRRYDEESDDVISSAIKAVKKNYKELSGNTLKSNKIQSTDSIEIIGFNVHNPKRTAYYRKKTSFEIA